MRIWGLILGGIGISLVTGLVFLSYEVGRFGLISKITGDRKGLRRIVSFAVVIFCCFLAAQMTSAVNAVIIYLHTFAFFVLSELIFWGIRRITGRTFRHHWAGICAIALTVLTMSVAYYLCMHVARTEYRLTTGKPIGALKAAFFADSHIGATFDGEGFAREMKKIEDDRPDILFICGDFVDESSKKADLVRACEALGKMDIPYGVWYVFGNHDAGSMGRRDFSTEDLRDIMAANGIHVMEDEAALVDDRFYVVGRRDARERSRKEISELMKDLDPDKYVIVLDHQPHDYRNESEANADLVLSGHTHGGQFFPFGYVGKLLDGYDRAYGHERRGTTDFLVTSGIADWQLWFKTGCGSEYVVVDIQS